ncbi:MAG: Fe-S cluster assembly protein SufB, partial [Sporomusaceae bacterium]|nr:Fe-S cluster assembly protein SufB [Sporomusaceae bacterium]
MEKKRTAVADIDRGLYDIKNEDRYRYKVSQGLTAEIVTKISREKNEPEWMLQFRLHSLEVYNQIALPEWGPSLDELNMDEIVTYVRP